VVTVLFADLVGFTALSEDRDPEQVKRLVDRCFERLVADIEAFGGRVDKIVGDAVLALFGAPIAHEDDAERAVRASLQFHRTLDNARADLGVDVRLRVGVNTGEVLVGSLRAGGDYTAMGDVVNTAQRLQSAAEPGQVLVGQATYLATRRVVTYRSIGTIVAKGRNAPVSAWVAEGARLPPGYRPDRHRAALVGRDDEVAGRRGGRRDGSGVPRRPRAAGPLRPLRRGQRVVAAGGGGAVRMQPRARRRSGHRGRQGARRGFRLHRHRRRH
jgi:class 3 adenylate cyclase